MFICKLLYDIICTVASRDRAGARQGVRVGQPFKRAVAVSSSAVQQLFRLQTGTRDSQTKFEYRRVLLKHNTHTHTHTCPPNYARTSQHLICLPSAAPPSAKAPREGRPRADATGGAVRGDRQKREATKRRTHPRREANAGDPYTGGLETGVLGTWGF